MRLCFYILLLLPDLTRTLAHAVASPHVLTRLTLHHVAVVIGATLVEGWRAAQHALQIVLHVETLRVRGFVRWVSRAFFGRIMVMMVTVSAVERTLTAGL